uniref:dihydrolipoyllysine-residue acetyltransferase n=1 Tax=Ningiella ruwaisensis TaxID=2364274 RepID=UPI0010A094A1|nr:dihydrolipoyllysine-residue acetyltransferase [Ningiella ruwaisensis]
MTDFILPDIGEGIVECELLKWLVAEGDTIKEDQPVAEVMTDKATVEIPAMHDGVVKKLYYKEGDIAKVHEPLFAMESVKESAKESASQSTGSNANSSADSNIKSEQLSESENKAGNPGQNSSTNEASSQNEQTESFLLPDIGEGIVECEIVKWSVKEGDSVEEDQVVVEVMTDKAVVEIPAKHAGTIAKLHYQEGEIAKVHTPLFDLSLEGVHSPETGSSQHDAVQPSASKENGNSLYKADNKNSASRPTAKSYSDNKQGENFEAPVVSKRPIASPAVRRMAKELGIQLESVHGSGKKGRIVKADVLKADGTRERASDHSEGSTNNAATNTENNEANRQAQHARASEQDRVEPVKGIRAAMAKQMMASVSSIPHFSVSDELSMDNLIALRAQLKPDFEKQGIKLSFMPFFIKALSLALSHYPIVNSRLNENGSELTYLASHNIGMAVDSKIGLLVPNIKNVQHLSLKEVAIEVNRIIDAARDGKLSNADLSGGTISISNIGTLGGITATPVINKPEVAIVALGKTQKLPRFDDNGEVYATNVMMLNWSGDHRVIDGATMVKFNNLWMDYLANPQKMLVDLR